MNCGHRLVWLGHWPSMHTSCEVSPQPGTFQSGNSNPGDRILYGNSYTNFCYFIDVNKKEERDRMQSSPSSCSVKLSTIVNKINFVTNKENSSIINDFYNYMQEKGSSENHQVNNLKVVIDFSNFLGPTTSFYDINRKEQLTSFLNRKIKSSDIDPDKRWITTWNHFLNRIKLFMRWLHNYHKNRLTNSKDDNNDDWVTTDFCKIKPKKTKRISPYLESEIWERDELLSIIKYESHKRNKAILALMWDLDSRPHEITSLKIKHIRLKEKYGEGEIPHEAKTGTGPILLTISFPYVRDWLNEHPYRNESNARLVIFTMVVH
jgi:integrase/recombinase XerD